MKANELRVGNYVIQDMEFIRGISSMSLHKFNLGLIQLKPILLVEEWIFAFGFEKNENGFFNLIKDSEVQILIRDDYWTCDGIVFSLFNLKYVHQLQNLYFALTGEELKIN